MNQRPNKTLSVMGDIDMPEAEYVQNYIVNRSVGKVPDAAFFIHIYFF